MDELKDLYQEMVMDHNKNPRNFGELKNATHHTEGYNPLCGDHIHIHLNLDDKKVNEIKFTGDGCAISKASASLMTGIIKGKSKQESLRIFGLFHRLITGVVLSDDELKELGKLSVFQDLCNFPSRVKCAGLCWHTLNSALNNENKKVSTE